MTTSPPDVDHDAWPDDDLDPDPRLHDLRGQGLTAVQLHTIQDVPITGSYL
ncbi:hypothetical protein [Streptomyces sp. NPDC005732]|uniref:hypothetical protein n=1 Tax=Streptomyces sp. NPDC005732 TaxID=3157057 RepID=UPI003405A0F2